MSMRYRSYPSPSVSSSWSHTFASDVQSGLRVLSISAISPEQVILVATFSSRIILGNFTLSGLILLSSCTDTSPTKAFLGAQNGVNLAVVMIASQGVVWAQQLRIRDTCPDGVAYSSVFDDQSNLVNLVGCFTQDLIVGKSSLWVTSYISSLRSDCTLAITRSPNRRRSLCNCQPQMAALFDCVECTIRCIVIPC